MNSNIIEFSSITFWDCFFQLLALGFLILPGIAVIGGVIFLIIKLKSKKNTTNQVGIVSGQARQEFLELHQEIHKLHQEITTLHQEIDILHQGIDELKTRV